MASLTSRTCIRAAVQGQSRRSLATVSSAAATPSSASSSSSSAPSSSGWRPPIQPGVEPAYDEALKLIESHQARLRQQLQAIKADVERHPTGSQERIQAEAKHESYVIASQIDDPEVRWRFENDPNASLSNPVFAHLREKAWRTERLPRIIERIRLMHVLPDAVPGRMTPEVDVQIFFGQGEGIDDHGGEGGNVLVGCFVSPDKTLDPPVISATPFHSEERLYTLALIDTDSPEPDQDRIGSFTHWLAHNIPLSITRTTLEAKPENIALPYIPPFPQQGTKYHRYSLVLLEQQKGHVQIQAPQEMAQTLGRRRHLRVHTLMRDLKLKPTGIHFWRAKWSKKASYAVSSIYRDVLKQDEPVFTHISPHHQ